jgi:MinD-like ATPase involved in chromosome partitioning or flagellar assembly
MTANTKRVVFTMGGKGGVGKTGVMVALAEWFEANQIPVTLLDLDTENKARGSLQHFFNGRVTKVNIHTPAGLDAFVDHLDGGTPIILADMGAGAGQVAADWFESMYDDVSATGVRFTAVGVVTPDPASVESVLAWASRLQERVEYVIVENATSALADFTYWKSTEQANRFREAFAPEILQMEFRLAELENPVASMVSNSGRSQTARPMSMNSRGRRSSCARRATGGGSSLNSTGQGRYSCHEHGTGNIQCRCRGGRADSVRLSRPACPGRDAGRVLSRSRAYSQTQPR